MSYSINKSVVINGILIDVKASLEDVFNPSMSSSDELVASFSYSINDSEVDITSIDVEQGEFTNVDENTLFDDLTLLAYEEDLITEFDTIRDHEQLHAFYEAIIKAVEYKAEDEIILGDANQSLLASIEEMMFEVCDQKGISVPAHNITSYATEPDQLLEHFSADSEGWSAPRQTFGNPRI
ncbi:hypothetical protein ACMXYX_17990 (plasmid) [Neptuniibacter sp. QD72_48]|uniref:hypothetical protein n=1 Tax=Neptuniibacter sp. QD72_48 TaxID=3398214 RepID=UPI0039F47FF2